MKIIILCGLPGSGKTTWAKQNYPGARIVSADDFFMVQGPTGKVYMFDPAKLSDAHALCLREFTETICDEIADMGFTINNHVDPGNEYMAAATRDGRYEEHMSLWNSQTVVVDNTNTTIAEIAPYAALALAYGHEMEIVYVSCDPAVAAARNIHGVSDLVIGQMVQRLRDLPASLPPWWPYRKVVAE